MSLKVCCFASGSKGNCCYVSDGETNVLIDLGISAVRVEKCLQVLGVNPDAVHVFVTHSHSDHVGGLKVFCKRHPSARLHFQPECAAAVCDITGVDCAPSERVVSLGSLTVTALPVPHDVPCFGYIVSDGSKSVAVVTDIGKVSEATRDALIPCDIVMIESNHDPVLLRNNRIYTPQLKRRISSDHGHLSNPDCAEACAYLAGKGVKNFILAHLSEDNNNPELAVSAVAERLAGSGISGVHIVAATQNKMTGLFEVC